MSSSPADASPAVPRARIVWDETGAHDVYADAARVTSSREEFSLLFGTSQTDDLKENLVRIRLTTRVMLNPFSAKRLAVQFNEAIRAYEAEYGGLEVGVPHVVEPAHVAEPRERKPARSAEEYSRTLFQLVESLGIEAGFEQSFKVVNTGLLENRFLLGVSKKAIGPAADERLTEICSLMRMPGAFFDVFRKYLPRGDYVHFGFELNGQNVVYKVYLEFWEEISAGIRNSRDRPHPALLHLGWKWDVSDPRRRALTRYTWHPWLPLEEITQRVSETLAPHKDAPPLQAAHDLVSLALARVSHRDVLYLDVSEDGNPRKSFDINVYRANLRVEEIYPILSALCRRHSLPFDTFHAVYDRIKMKRLGHLAAGVDREGRGFFTVYYGVEGVFGKTSADPGKAEGTGTHSKYAMPARRRRLVHVEETDDKAGRLFQLVKGLGMREAFERSFKFLDRTLLTERFLTGFKRTAESGGQDDLILDICRQINMPEDFLERFQSELHEANIVLFAFEKNEKSRVYKAYLEFSGRLAEAARQDPKPESVVIHTGFKWDVSDNSRKVTATYVAYPLFQAAEVAAHVRDSFYGGAGKNPFPIVDDILDLAGTRTYPGELLYFEVSEEGNPRNSFDINAYRANLRMAEIYPILIRMARHYSIDLDRFDELYEGVRDMKFGHLSGGTDREGRDFLTVYFSVRGSSRRIPPEKLESPRQDLAGRSLNDRVS